MRKVCRLILMASALLFASSSAFAQRSPFDSDENRMFEDGVTFYGETNYAAASRHLEDYLANTSDEESEKTRMARYYIAMAAYNLRKDDAQTKLEQYQERYPYATEAPLMDFYIGILEYECGKYKQAIKRFEKVDISNLTEEETCQLYFYKGYSYLQQKDYKRSAYEFDKALKFNENEYTNPTHYYYGYSHYLLGNYKTSIEHLKIVENDQRFKASAPFIICQCYYKLELCEELKEYGTKTLKANPNGNGANSLRQMLGSCCFKTQDYDGTIKWMTEYANNVKKLDRQDWYMLGMASYMTGKYDNAVKYLSKVTTKEDILSQNSYFHIGMAYLKSNNKTNARMSFEAAARYKFDMEEKEDALYNYALITYETSFSPFNESVSAFEKLLTEFPDTKYKQNVYKYLLSVYLTTNNYEAAYNSIKKIGSNDPSIKAAEQRVLYGLGTTAVANRKYSEAAKTFEEIIAGKSYNAGILAKSYFWHGECMFRSGKYSDAKSDFEKYLSNATSRKDEEYNTAHYNLGYCCMRLNDYTNACSWFRKYVASEKDNKEMILDSYNRIGDCYFAQRQYDQALSAYNNAVKTGSDLSGADYSLYQKGLICGLKKDYSGKVRQLKELLAKYPKSEWADDALFEIGKAYVAQNDYDNAIDAYQQICEKYSKSNPIVRKSKLQIAMLQYNSGKTNDAINSYQYIVNTYPKTEEAETSLATLESIMVDNNRVEEYTAIAQKAGKNTSTKEDSLLYKAAEKVYFKDDFKNAATSLNKYLSTYPNGKYSSLARYYLANCHYRLGDNTNALKAYAQILDDPNNPNMELSLVRASSIAYDMKKYADAEKYFEQLKEVGSVENKKAASLGVLRCAYENKNYDNTILEATDIISNYGENGENAEEARYKRMKSYIALGKEDKAIDDIKKLSNDTRTEYGAEAKYLLIAHYSDAKQYSEAEAEFFDFVNKGTTHAYWLAKAFIQIADVYIAQDNYFEAKQYLLSLNENYKDADADLRAAIAKRLDIIEKHESETISSND